MESEFDRLILSRLKGPVPAKRRTVRGIDYAENGLYDVHPTPPEFTLALLDHVRIVGSVWEPACGEGDMAEVLIENLPNSPVLCTDIMDHGYPNGMVMDFFSEEASRIQCDNIITNPPYFRSIEFVIESLERANRIVAMLVKKEFASGVDRYKRLTSIRPPNLIINFPSHMRNRHTGNRYSFSHCWWVWSNLFFRAQWDLTVDNTEWCKTIWVDNTAEGKYRRQRR